MKLVTFTSIVAVLSLSVVLRAEAPAPGDRLVVHEWGTFTALQDEQGRSIRGINTDDEPLPSFVHDAHGMLLQNPSDIPPVQFKGVSRVHPDVVVRLETPVLYFYPPRDKPSLKLNVRVDFKGGWLTQFYPDAKATNPGLRQQMNDPGAITPGTIGSLQWNDLLVEGKMNGPRTDSRVWLAPREVQAASVTTTGKEKETERYLFYRGVGQINPPLKVTRSAADPNRLELTPTTKEGITAAWLVDVRQDGAIAFRVIKVDRLVREGGANISTSATFAERDYAAENLKGIRTELKAGLKADGLFDDEAEAMMNTWEAAYFKRPGLRVFFMVPREWTDAVLPLRITGDATDKMDVQRAIIGRIEVVTPFQRERLMRIGRTTPASGMWLNAAIQKALANTSDKYREDWYRDVFSGQRSLLDVNIEMPPEFRDYLQLGRFRNALILDELTRHPSANLQKFVETYALEYSKVDPEAATATSNARVVPATK
jgi:hypothetical protein